VGCFAASSSSVCLGTMRTHCSLSGHGPFLLFFLVKQEGVLSGGALMGESIQKSGLLFSLGCVVVVHVVVVVVVSIR